MSSTLWTEGGKLVENSDGLLVVCSRCPCCVSPREATIAWQHVKTTYTVARTDTFFGTPDIVITYTGTFFTVLSRVPFTDPAPSLGPDTFYLQEFDCCKCRWLANIQRGGGLVEGVFYTEGDVTTTSSAGGGSTIHVSTANLQTQWSPGDIQCKSASTPGPEPIEYFANFDLLGLATTFTTTSPEVTTTVNGVPVGTSGSYYDGRIDRVFFPAGSTPCDDTNTYTIISRIIASDDTSSVDSTVTLKIEFY